MCYRKLSHPVTMIAVVLLFLVGCSAPSAAPAPATVAPPSPTPVPPTVALPTQTPVPPTVAPPTPTPVPATVAPPTPTPPVLITSAEMLIGTWKPLSRDPDVMFLQLNSDGACRQSYSLDGLTKAPEVEGTCIFEGTDLLMTGVKLHDVNPCPSPTGKYQVRLMADNQIELVPTKDTCGPRKRSTVGQYERIPPSVQATPSPQLTAKPPAGTPTPVFTLLKSAEEIVGTWLAAGDYYIRFDKDGTFRQAHSLANLDRQPYSINTYRFDGTKLVATEISVSGVPTCGKRPGSYEIRLLESGNIRIVATEDRCQQRASDIAGEYEPVR